MHRPAAACIACEYEDGGKTLHYLVTGGAGFIGSHLVERLLSQGHQVSVLDNLSSAIPRWLEAGGARLVTGCVTDRQLVSSVASRCERIIHLAAVVGVRKAMAEGIETLRVSYLGTECVLEAATQLGCPVFIASSSAVYGKISREAVSEDDDGVVGTAGKPSWLYSVGKLVEEHLAMAYFRERGADVRIGRFFNVIGPYQRGDYGMVVPVFVTRALQNEPLVVYGTGRQTRTFVHIEDALDGLQLVIERGDAGGIYNIGGTEEISILDLARRVLQLTGSSSPVQLVPFHVAFDRHFEETPRRKPDISRLCGLGYSPRRDLDRAISDIIRHHRGDQDR